MSSSFEFPELVSAPPGAEAPAEPGDEEADASEAIEAARAEAYAAGVRAGRAEVASAVEALVAARSELAAEREHAADRAEREAVELALQIAEKVVETALEVRPELVVEAVRGALRRMVEPQESVLVVNPEDAETVRAALDGLSAELGAPLRVRTERRVSRGGCIVRTQAGELDSCVAKRLERARAVVEAELGG